MIVFICTIHHLSTNPPSGKHYYFEPTWPFFEAQRMSNCLAQKVRNVKIYIVYQVEYKLKYHAFVYFPQFKEIC